MPDNLSISIGIDTAKLRADAAIVKEELRKVNAEVKAAAQAGNVAGVQAGAAQQDRLIRQLRELNQELRVNTTVKRENTAATDQETESARQLGLEFGHLAHLVGLPIEGIKALKFGFAAFASAEIVRAIKEINSELTALIELSRETRFDPSTIQAWSLAIERAGGSAETAKASIQTFGAAVLDQQKALRDAEAAGRRVFSSTLAGGGTQAQATAAMNKVISDANQSSKALNGSLAQLGVTAGRFAANANGMRQALHQAALELVRLHQYNELEADLQSRELFGKPYTDMAAALELAAKGSGDLLEKQAGLVKLTKEQIEANQQYNAVVNEVSHAWTEFSTVLVTDVGPAIGIVLEALVTLIKLVSQAIEGWKELAGFIGGGEGGGAGAVELSDKAQARIDSGQVPGHAAGGYIRGPGSGTSDSVLARLSNGEFVLNAGSVRRLGVGFLHGLNSFAAGGLVSAPPISFAAGGLVPAAGGGGRAVHLHLGSGSFALSGQDNVVSALVGEAQRQQMRSAGVKPSWFAGRG